jgi:hypothetical protein
LFRLTKEIPMRRQMTDRSVKPCLETLEGRDLPSFLPTGVVGVLVRPLGNLSQDLTKAQTDLKAQVQTLSAPTNHSLNDLAKAFGQATADWQRVQFDQHAIDALSTAEIALMKRVADAEFAQGDTLDYMLLTYGPMLGMDPTAPLKAYATQADAAVHDPDLITEITTPITFGGTVNLGTIQDAVPPPPF